jgi:hypothetical protein
MKSNLSHKDPINKLPIPKIDLSTIFTTTVGVFGSSRSWFVDRFKRTATATSGDDNKLEKSDAQKKFERKRNLAIVGAILFMIVYVIRNGIIHIEIVNDDDYNKNGDDDDDYVFVDEVDDIEVDDIEVDDIEVNDGNDE